MLLAMRLQAVVAESTELGPLVGTSAARRSKIESARLCSAVCRSLPLANPGWEHRLTTGPSWGNPDSQTDRTFGRVLSLAEVFGETLQLPREGVFNRSRQAPGWAGRGRRDRGDHPVRPGVPGLDQGLLALLQVD